VFFFQAEDGIRDFHVTGVQTCALPILVLVVVREVGPLFTAFLVAGRTGSALSTYLGNMKVQQEIDALKTMGVDPVRYLVYPSFRSEERRVGQECGSRDC